MEVHHPHHVTHKKKWTEYLLEFFMLFLAVFLGFIAENVREGQVEKSQEKEYIKGVVEDLRTDTAKINRLIPLLEEQITGYDSLFNYSTMEPHTDSAIRYMYYLIRRYTYTRNFTTTTRTFNQLNNAGGMRLIKNKTASDSIIRYYDYANSNSIQLEYFRNAQTIAYTTGYSIFKAKAYNGITRATAYMILSSPQKLANDNPEQLNVFANEVRTVSGSLTNYKTNLLAQRENCLRVLKTLQDEYHLEQE